MGIKQLAELVVVMVGSVIFMYGVYFDSKIPLIIGYIMTFFVPFLSAILDD